MASKRHCLTCGAEYEYCPGCARSAGKPEWMLLWDTEECMKVFDTVSGYNIKNIDADGVKSALIEIGVTNYDKYIPRIRKQLQKIVPAAELKQQKMVDIDFGKKI